MKNKLGILLVSLMCFSGCGNGTNTSSQQSISNSVNVPSFSSSSSKKEEDRIAVYSLENKGSFVNYAQYKGEQINKEEEFMDREQSYKVGDENAFSFKPQLTLAVLPAGKTDIDDVEFRYNADWSYNVTLSLLNDNNEYVDANLEEFTDSLDNDNCLIDFSDAAIGHTFKVSLYPEGLNEEQIKELKTKWTKEYEFEVVEGYNVTNAKELAYIQNDTANMPNIGTSEATKGKKYKEVWDAFKNANQLKVDYNPSALILHNDINITVDDLPSEYFYNEEETLGFFSKDEPNYKKVLGSLKDWVHIYYRDFEKNSEFHLEGNYFSLNISSIPIVVKGNETNQVPENFISHSVLFSFQGDKTGKSSIKNIKLVGNAPRKDESTLSGGVILTKVQGPDFKAYNNVANRWFITYFPNKSASAFLMDKCRAYNNFNSFIYNWGSKDVTIRDCEFKRAGGPVIIQECLYIDDADPANDVDGSIKIENSVLESIVAGSEGWFTTMSADQMAMQVKGLDYFFKQNDRSFLSKRNNLEYFNLISVIKPDLGESISFNYNTRGSISIENDTTNYTFNYGEEGASNPYFGTFYQGLLLNPKTQEAPIFETSAGGMAFSDGSTGIYSLDFQTFNPVPLAKNDNMFKGDYLAIYKGGMQFIMDYYEYEKPAE